MLAFASQARAQDAVLDTKAIIDVPITVDAADMDFGDIIPRTNPGTVLLTAAATAQCTTTGGLLQSGACRAATFEGTARFLSRLTVRRPNGDRIDLTGPLGAQMRVDNFTFGAGPGLLDGGPSGANHRFWILNFNGAYTFYVGGTLHVGANQTPGVYTGTFDVQISYN